MKYVTCPNHPGTIVENRPCPRCGSPQVRPEGRPPFRSRFEDGPANGHTEGASMEPVKDQTSTVALDATVSIGRKGGGRGHG